MEILSVTGFLDYYDKIWSRTIRVIKKIPHAKIDWRPNSKSFSIKDIIIHMVNLERFMFAETVINNINKYPGHNKSEIKDFQGMVSYIHTLHKETVNLFGKIQDKDLNKRCTTPDNASIRIWKWLRAMIEHHIHHRGQIYTYLNLMEIESPPLYGLTSEEVKERRNN